MCSSLSEDQQLTSEDGMEDSLSAAPASDIGQCSEQPPPATQPSSAQNSEHNNDDNDHFSDDYTNDDGYQCGNCSSKFMSENSMRIHAVQCNKSRISQAKTEEEMPRNEANKRYAFLSVKCKQQMTSKMIFLKLNSTHCYPKNLGQSSFLLFSSYIPHSCCLCAIC